AVASLAGNWSGNGRITYTDGSSESITCSAYNTSSGNELKLAIQCKSDKNPIHLRSHLKVDGSKASGTWEERTFNATGNATGTVGDGTMALKVSGGGFEGSMHMNFSKAQHTVAIATEGIAMKKATMTFRH